MIPIILSVKITLTKSLNELIWHIMLDFDQSSSVKLAQGTEHTAYS